MLYYSTNKNSPEVSFQDALITGQAPDRGLYLPKSYPKLSQEIIASFREKPYWEIAKIVALNLLQGEVPEADLERIVKDAYDFDVPIKTITENLSVLYLDQGPTLSFKDFAARMMARLMSYFIEQRDQKLTILTATSGDTGGAVADAFYKVKNIDVIVLYPYKEISERQRKQMTTLGENITAIGVNGKFDDCQAMVKEAFADPDLTYINLSSANSINFGRLLPQTVYYFYAYSRLVDNDGKIIFSVPSGNFGDLMGGIIASKMGLPVERFIAAVNENDEFPRFLETGTYSKIEPSKACLSNAMNVGHPSNLARLIDLYGGHLDEKGTLLEKPDMEAMNKDIYSVSVSDEETRQTIKEAYENHQVVFEPHGAVGWKGLLTYVSTHDVETACCSFETAHPCKFPEEIRSILKIEPDLAPNMAALLKKPETITNISANYSEFKEILEEKYKNV